MTFVMTPWQEPPPQPQLSQEAVHLWRFPLDCHDLGEDILDEQELQRARRLRIPEKSRQFVVARTRLRQILATYLDRSPRDLHFHYGFAGKPALAGPGADSLAFNLAHSGSWGLCAVSRGFEVGVDIDQVDRLLDIDRLAVQFFSESERRSLLNCHPLRQRRQFMRIWTRKEAWLKGKGGGFSDPELNLGPEHLQQCASYAGNWWLCNFPVHRNYLGALAAARQISLLQRWNAWPLPV